MGDQDWEWLFIVRIDYVRMMDPMTYDSGYLIALVERWDAFTNTFMLPTGECTITLKDTYRIFRISIEGEPMIGLEVDTR